MGGHSHGKKHRRRSGSRSRSKSPSDREHKGLDRDDYLANLKTALDPDPFNQHSNRPTHIVKRFLLAMYMGVEIEQVYNVISPTFLFYCDEFPDVRTKDEYVMLMEDARNSRARYSVYIDDMFSEHHKVCARFRVESIMGPAAPLTETSSFGVFLVQDGKVEEFFLMAQPLAVRGGNEPQVVPPQMIAPPMAQPQIVMGQSQPRYITGPSVTRSVRTSVSGAPANTAPSRSASAVSATPIVSFPPSPAPSAVNAPHYRPVPVPRYAPGGQGHRVLTPTHSADTILHATRQPSMPHVPMGDRRMSGGGYVHLPQWQEYS